MYVKYDTVQITVQLYTADTRAIRRGAGSARRARRLERRGRRDGAWWLRRRRLGGGIAVAQAQAATIASSEVPRRWYTCCVPVAKYLSNMMLSIVVSSAPSSHCDQKVRPPWSCNFGTTAALRAQAPKTALGDSWWSARDHDDETSPPPPPGRRPRAPRTASHTRSVKSCH